MYKSNRSLHRKSKVIFPLHHLVKTKDLDAPRNNSAGLIEISEDTKSHSGASPRNDRSTAIMASDVQHPSAPSLFTQPPPFQEQINAFPTITSSAEDQTLLECLPFLISPEMELNSHGVPKLRRRVHMMYLTMMLRRKFPPGFVAIDASRPWFLYWSLTGLHCLGEDLSGFAQEVVDTLRPCQSHDGGFGGGHGQMSHTATSYASVLSLVSVGRQDALDLIDRKAMYAKFRSHVFREIALT